MFDISNLDEYIIGIRFDLVVFKFHVSQKYIMHVA